MKKSQLHTDEYAAYYGTYIDTVTNEYNLVEELEISVHRLVKFVQDIPMDKFDYRYAEGKWTIRQMLQHMIDTERVFSYRATAFARGEQQGLPGFDENAYAAAADVTIRNFQEMKEELLILRRSVHFMYKGFTLEALMAAGEANHNRVTVNALGYIIVGHVRHHFRILKERYL